MPRISTFLLATTVILTASTTVFGMPPREASAPDIAGLSFSVFFEPGVASLSKEAREIISIAAKRFADTHSGHSAARIFVTSESNEQDKISLSSERIKAVHNQLVHDGVQGKFVSRNEQPNVHSEPVRLLESLDRRVSIEIRENTQESAVIGRF